MQKGDKDDSSVSSKHPVPLRTILRNFLNLVENYESCQNGEYDLYDQEFQELKHFSESLKSDPYYQTKEGERSVNRKKNRYKDILPFDYSRVSLSDVGDVPGSDYVNANFIKGASGSLAYIACQGPLPHTVNDFWRMVIESEVQVIVMACMQQESGKHKCENYWVEDDGLEREFGEVTVWLKKCRNVCSDFLVRTMRIRFPNKKGEMEERNVCQFHYSAWPDHGIPTKVRPLLDMVRLIRNCQTSETLPVLVHCSAGCGRTGTICAIDYVWGLLRLGKLSEDFSLFNLVREMRRQRIAMVQTKDQYILVHRAVKELFQEQLKIIDAHPYANVDQNGLPVEIRQELEEPTYVTIDFKCKGPLPSRSPSPSKTSSELLIRDNNNLRHKTSRKIPIWKGANQKYKDEVTPSAGNFSTPEPVPKSDKKEKAKNEEEDMISSVTNSEDTVDCGSFPVHKVSSPSISPNRAASILRKPSIVKLRAFFEKTSKPDKNCPKKTNVTIYGLSRAKSDVTASSRFYSFAASLSGSKGSGEHGATSSGTKPSPKPHDAENTQELKSKPNKPPIFAKTAMAVKRSKSLKIHPEDAGVKASLAETVPKSNQDPIKVCVKQTEIPIVRHVSVSENEYELLKPNFRLADRRESLEKLINPSVSEKLSSSVKPPLPLKVHALMHDHRKANKLKVAEDSENSFKNLALLKSNENVSITPKSAILVGSVIAPNGCLTRSQSHVWHPSKVEPTLSAGTFSNENIYKPDREQDLLQRAEPPDISHLDIKSQNEATLSPILSNPIARRRLPKVAVYSNYFPEQNLSANSGNCLIKERFTPPFALSGMNYTSDSSNSLPSTPTQSIDRRNGQNGENSPQLCNQSAVSRPLLKGSLSSTPSDSDELLDLNRPKFSSTTVVTISSTNPVLVNNMVSRNPLPMRERRNSFRQAVWKEVQNDVDQGNLDGGCSAGDNSNPVIAGVGCHGNQVLPSSHRTHKDYEPIWPSHGTGATSRHLQANGNPSNVSSNGKKSRIEAFSGILNDLKAVNGARALESSPNCTSHECKRSPTLKYHRSLKAPSRSDYELSNQAIGGKSTLSCFTFKKPTSLESLADQLQSEERSMQKSLSDSRDQSGKGQRDRSLGSSGNHGFHRSNDYVTLEHCRTDASCGFRVAMDDLEIQRHCHSNGDKPIPPPRTKAKKVTSQQSDASRSALTGSETTVSNPVNGDGSCRRRMKSGDSSNPGSSISSTKTKALGIFHDMKSKLVNWTEPSARTQHSGSNAWQRKQGSEESNGSSSTSSGSRESPWHPGSHRSENGVSNPSFTGRQVSASRPTSKQQYL